MKKVAASTQNTSLPVPRRSARKLSSTKLAVGRGGTGGIVVSPNGASPNSCGRSLLSATNSTIITNRPRLEGTSAARQPQCSAIQAASGMNSSVPVAIAPFNRPTTMPRWAVNQRDEITAPSCIAIRPGAIPSSAPKPSHSSNRVVMVAVNSSPISASAPDTATMRRGP